MLLFCKYITMKLIFVFLLCFSCILLAHLGEAGPNINQCADPNENLKLLCLFDIDQTFSWFGYAKKRIHCPSSGLNQNKIVCIKVTDVSDANQGGQAVIENGGIGYNFVEISLTSKLMKGLEYHIEVYTVSPSTSTIVAPTAPK